MRTTTPPRPAGMAPRVSATNRATASGDAPGGSVTYSTPAPAEPLMAGRSPPSRGAASIAASTALSADTHSEIRTSVPPAGTAGRLRHQPGAVAEMAGGPGETLTLAAPGWAPRA